MYVRLHADVNRLIYFLNEKLKPYIYNLEQNKDHLCILNFEF